MSVPTHLSQWSQRSAHQAIGYLMQQAVENPGCISLAAGLVDERSLPAALVRNAVDELLADTDAGRRLLQYGTTQGPEPLRRVYRNYLAELEGRSDALADLPLSRLMLTTGSQQLLALVVQALFDAGNICLVAAPTYFVFLGVLQAAGAEAIPVESDSQGMRPEALQATLERLASEDRLGRVRLIYVVSDFENPSGVSVPLERRRELLRLAENWSRASQIYLLEDAAYRELRFEGTAPPSIWSLDQSHKTVILAQTFSKSFSPGIRVGLGVLPESLVKPVADLKGNEDFGSAHLNQHIVATVLRNGSYRRHVAAVVASYRSKRNAMLNAIDREFHGLHGVSWVRPAGGMYVWMRLPQMIQTGFDSPLFQQATRVNRVMYVPGELCYPSSWRDRPRCEMRLSFGVQSEAGIEEGIRRLATAVSAVIERISGNNRE
ncbi:MAG: PLP-dependent aminotransferase family protein [Planctomycetota bacterium]